MPVIKEPRREKDKKKKKRTFIYSVKKTAQGEFILFIKGYRKKSTVVDSSTLTRPLSIKAGLALAQRVPCYDAWHWPPGLGPAHRRVSTAATGRRLLSMQWRLQ